MGAASDLQPDATLQRDSAGGVSLATYVWERVEGPPRGIVQLLHGMSEHVQRYGHLARALNAVGFVVVGHDHRGHGATDTGTPGYFADEGGWELLVEDVHRVAMLASERFPGLGRALFAHSMGSFVAQSYLPRYGDGLAAALLSGTTGGTAAATRAGAVVARAERFRLGKRATSELLQKLSFGAYGRAFQPNRTEFDWLSRDPIEVDRYVADPLCGQPITTHGWVDVLDGMTAMQGKAVQARVPKRLPIMLIAGDRDPVGDQGRGVRWLEDRYRAAGVQQVECKLYPGARHEVVNETNRDEVIADVVSWMQRHL